MPRRDSHHCDSVLNAAAGVLAALLFAPITALAQQPSPPAATPAAPAERPAFFDEPRILARSISWIEDYGRDDNGRPRDGFYPELGHMITGAGWISAGPGYRQHLFKGHVLVDGSAAISWRAYKIAQARVELPYLADERLVVGAKGLWQDFTQVRYYGAGPYTLETGVSDYRIETIDAVGYATWKAFRHLDVMGSAGWLGRPTLFRSAGPFDRDEPDAMSLYASDSAADLATQPTYLHASAGVTFDTRDHPSYPIRGDLYRTGVATFRDRLDGTYTFDRFEFEAARFMPLARERGVFAVHWWTVLSHTGANREVPFYLLPSLGGHNTLRGYADYRFHDRHLMVVNAESRWALFPHLDGAVFFDAGSVATRVRDLDFGRTAAGFGVRVHTHSITLARFDIARSQEGWQFMMRLSDPCRLGRLSRRTMAIPVVP